MFNKDYLQKFKLHFYSNYALRMTDAHCTVYNNEINYVFCDRLEDSHSFCSKIICTFFVNQGKGKYK